jgi:hypothetical protein
MKTFILFIFGLFDDMEDIEYFCSDVLSDCKTISSIRYVIENGQNIIVIFDSEVDYKELAQDLYGNIVNENIKLYFIFERDSLVTAHLPQNVKDFIFRPSSPDDFQVRLDYTHTDIDLDDVLDKIEQDGIESLTPEEKNFLDNFEN